MAARCQRRTRPGGARFSPFACPGKGRARKVDRAKIKILVVDDEQGLCAGVQEALRREGYVVDATTDPQAALKLAQERLFNLVISDIKMPGLSGLELLKQVRE